MVYSVVRFSGVEWRGDAQSIALQLYYFYTQYLNFFRLISSFLNYKKEKEEFLLDRVISMVVHLAWLGALCMMM